MRIRLCLCTSLLLVITSIITTFLTLVSGLSLLAPNTSWSATTERRSQSEINVLLRIQTDNERRNVDNLLANSDVALLDQDTSVVNGLGETELVDTGLQSALQEIFDLKSKHVIELHAGLIEHTDSDETSDQSVTFEQTLGILLIEREQLTIQSSVSRPQPQDSNLPSSTSNL